MFCPSTQFGDRVVSPILRDGGELDVERPVDCDFHRAVLTVHATKDADENHIATCRACHPAETGSPWIQLATLYGSLS